MKTTCLTSSLFSFFLLFLFFIPAHAGETEGTKVEVKADDLRIDSTKNTATFTGNVKANFGSMLVTCKKLSVVYGENGSIESFVAEGGVTVKKGQTTARAQSASLQVATEKLLLRGNPSLERDGNRLLGKTIEVDIKLGKIEVVKARGTFFIKKRQK